MTARRPALAVLAAAGLAAAGCADTADKPGARDDRAPPAGDSGPGADTGPEAAATCLPAPPPTIVPCGTGPIDRQSLLAGPGNDDHDAVLAEKAHRFDRVFHGLITRNTGLSTELGLVDGPDSTARIAAWLDADDGRDFEAWSGGPVTEVVASWSKVAGGYGGVGVAADAFRYGALRDEGADCETVAAARTELLAALEGLHRVVEITGVEGVIARGIASLDNPGISESVETVPLFDDDGAPLPAEKDNGTWRADNSGLHPGHVWEDSCSRDMLVGWAAGFAAAWEVVRHDPDIDAATKTRLADDARAIARSLLTVQESGYDLEVMDADGRRTYHGLLHENSVDRYYADGIENGQNALMAVGALAALGATAEDPTVLDALAGPLLTTRELGRIAREKAHLIDFGPASNYSGYNMGFLGGWMATRYTCGDDHRADLGLGVADDMYDRAGQDRQPIEQSQALYHLVAAQALGGQSLWPSAALPTSDAVDRAAAAREATLAVLRDFPDAPYVPESRTNCDEDELAAGVCTAADGTPLTLLGPVGWNDTWVSAEPVPMAIRPPSNYHWRSNPYQVNGEASGTQLYSGVDFRFVYWMGRYVQR